MSTTTPNITTSHSVFFEETHLLNASIDTTLDSFISALLTSSSEQIFSNNNNQPAIDKAYLQQVFAYEPAHIQDLTNQVIAPLVSFLETRDIINTIEPLQKIDKDKAMPIIIPRLKALLIRDDIQHSQKANIALKVFISIFSHLDDKVTKKINKISLELILKNEDPDDTSEFSREELKELRTSLDRCNLAVRNAFESLKQSHENHLQSMEESKKQTAEIIEDIKRKREIRNQEHEEWMKKEEQRHQESVKKIQEESNKRKEKISKASENHRKILTQEKSIPEKNNRNISLMSVAKIIFIISTGILIFVGLVLIAKNKRIWMVKPFKLNQ